MNEPPVVNASPVIVLARAGYLTLLHVGGDPVLVPRAVAHEIQRGGPNDPAAQGLAQTNWLQVVDPGPTPPALQGYRLNPGETAVLTWALSHPGTEALLDELPARRCALALGIPHRGTAGLVIAARRQGIIPLARPVLEQLRQLGLYLTDQVMNQALALVGE